MGGIEIMGLMGVPPSQASRISYSSHSSYATPSTEPYPASTCCTAAMSESLR